MRFASILAALAVLSIAGVANAQGNYGGHGPIPVNWTNPVVVDDDSALSVGTGGDYSCVHDGTDTVCTSATGDFILDNTDVNDPTVIRLGTDTAATDFVVRNNSDAALLNVDGAGSVTLGTGLLALDLIDCATTVGAENTNVIEVAIACVHADGTAVNEVQTLVVSLYSDAALTTFSDGDIDFSDGGNGALVVDYTSALSHGVFVTNAAGVAEIDITDGVGGSGETHYIQIAGRSTGGRFLIGSLDAITFD